MLESLPSCLSVLGLETPEFSAFSAAIIRQRERKEGSAETSADFWWHREQQHS